MCSLDEAFQLVRTDRGICIAMCTRYGECGWQNTVSLSENVHLAAISNVWHNSGRRVSSVPTVTYRVRPRFNLHFVHEPDSSEIRVYNYSIIIQCIRLWLIDHT